MPRNAVSKDSSRSGMSALRRSGRLRVIVRTESESSNITVEAGMALLSASVVAQRRRSWSLVAEWGMGSVVPQAIGQAIQDLASGSLAGGCRVSERGDSEEVIAGEVNRAQ